MPYTRSTRAKIYYELHGQGETAMVLSAGMGGSGSFWAPQLPALTRKHTVILYDHVGTGRSISAAGTGPRSIPDMADDVITVMDDAGIAMAHFAGHAIGGIIGLELALRHPGRLHSLAVVNGWGRADGFLRRCFEVRKGILLQSGPQAYVRAQPLFLYPPQWISENGARLDEEEARILAHFPAPHVMRDRIDTFLAFDGLDRIRAIDLPVLLLAAKDDALVPAYLSGELAVALPRAELVEVPWGAHAFTAVDPALFNAAFLNFCRDVVPCL